MSENISWKATGTILLSIVFIAVLMIWGFDAMAYVIHRGMFEQKKLTTGQPYSYEELDQCSGGIYRNLKEYQEFFEYKTLSGSEILSKKEYEIVSKKPAVFLYGTPLFEKENPTYYYCLTKRRW